MKSQIKISGNLYVSNIDYSKFTNDGIEILVEGDVIDCLGDFSIIREGDSFLDVEKMQISNIFIFTSTGLKQALIIN